MTFPSEPTLAAPPESKRCPDCAEDVRAAARICRYCRYDFVNERSYQPAPVPVLIEEHRPPLHVRVFRRALPILLGLFIILVVFAFVVIKISAALAQLPSGVLSH